MFDENNFSNDNSYEQNNSQAVPGGSVAAHTDNNNGQAAGKATGSYSGVNPGSGQSGPGEPYTQATGMPAREHTAMALREPISRRLPDGGYQNTGYQADPEQTDSLTEIQRLWQLPVQSGTLPIRKPFF